MAWNSESDLELGMLEKLREQGFEVRSGADISPEVRDPERRSFHDAILKKVLRAAVARLNPDLSEGAVDEVVAKVADDALGGDLIAENRRMHDLMIRGVPVAYFSNGEERNARARLVDWDDKANTWQAINQVDMVGRVARIPDIVLYLNGMPLVVIELKGTEGADIEAAFTQIENYKIDIPNLFRSTIFSVVSDGFNARYGTLSANLDRFMQWRTVDGQTVIRENEALALGTLTEGLLNRAVLLDMLHWFAVFEDEGKGPIKKAAGYHQFHAVRKAIDSIVTARGDDGKGGVIWHTQGSGKSLLMTFLAGRVMHLPELENPTVLVLTDRNDLDNQLFTTFGRCRDLLGEDPVQADSIDDLKTRLNREVGGIVFSTIQKFRPERGRDFPELTSRSNVIVMVDEAHRTQYGFDAKIDEKSGELRRGLAHHLRSALPNGVYVAFTGTPVELVGANTRSVFGDYIDVYDIAQAVEDGATVPIYYEGRVARIELDADVKEVLDEEFDEATEGLADDEANAAARRWSGIEKLVGAPTRLDAVVEDILSHFDARLEAIDGKAMIVCMSRRICVDVYERIVAARPDWHSDTDDDGAVKVVMTGSATDPANFQPHIRNKARLEGLRRRYKDVSDPLKLVIVRDIWLTGFDAPCMHTLYVDKPMKGHGLMQAIARVNRVFSGKPAGLVVDYIGLAAELKNALAHYSQGDQAQTGVDEREAVAAFLTALDVARGVFHGFDYSRALGGSSADRIEILPKAADHILKKSREDGNEQIDDFGKRYMDAVASLAKAFKLAAGSLEASDNAEEVAFFLAVRSALQKLDVTGGRKGGNSPDFAIEQLLNRAVASTEVIDILEACGFDRPDISVLSEEFLLEIQNMEHKNLAVEALKKLLNGEIAARTRGNVVQNEKFSERLTSAISRYLNRSVDALQVIQELIALAKDLHAVPPDNLTNEERSFYDALAQNETAVEVLGNEELRIIATELVNSVRASSGVDWWEREDVRARMRVAVKRILRKYGYPPDLQAEAVILVIKQAEALARNAA
ncbi:type I restriction endonuclease subunit R [Maritimibacter sp. DP1N21-5]|uniref:type I restriction endonuclease subunit R n=1 Tax=Maritimibacter sp. DP1N21-5 TaxID=2836867 RepID=UPI001C45A025|nr:type I restriction endonuclease subunit R [Maritimibacter sp. DP1N21-5]MBV7411126.1 type I restriction endonuclease subunit R [Maritimibacter sp. DP1N21-5]